MLKRNHLTLLLGAAFALGMSMQANAQTDQSSDNTAQQTPQQGQLGNQNPSNQTDQTTRSNQQGEYNPNTQGQSGASEGYNRNQEGHRNGNWEEHGQRKDHQNGARSDHSNWQDNQTASDTATGPHGDFIKGQTSSQMLASSLIGMSLRNGTGKDAQDVGSITDLILNQQHQVVGVLVNVGGFLGLGQRTIGISTDKIQMLEPGNNTAVLNISTAELKQAPQFMTKKEKADKQQPAQ